MWKIKLCISQDFAKALIGFNHEVEKDFITASSPFAFSKVEERRFIRFFKLLGCTNSQIGELTKHVDDRNDVAHSNGNIFYRTQEELDAKIRDIIRCIEQLQPCFTDLTIKVFTDFLEYSYNPDDREYNDDKDQIAEILLKKNYLSTKDIDICLKYDITSMSANPEYSVIKAFFNSFK